MYPWCCGKDLDEQELMKFFWQDLASECGT
jgi:hypothetical protein